MKKQAEVTIEELEYLDEMGEKAVEVLKKLFLNKEYEVTKETPFPTELMEMGARILIEVAVKNTPIRGYHVLPLIEGHLFLLNVQDKNQNTVADVIFFADLADNQLVVEDIIVTYKPGAILYRYEELANEEEQFESSQEPALA